MNMIPVGNRVIVKPDPPRMETESGLVLPPNELEMMPQSGTVLATNGKKDCPVKVGDRIAFPKYGGPMFDLNQVDGEIMIVDYEKIIGVYDE